MLIELYNLLNLYYCYCNYIIIIIIKIKMKLSDQFQSLSLLLHKIKRVARLIVIEDRSLNSNL